MFPTCRGNVVHTTASLPHFTVPTGARLCGVWGGLCPPLSSPGRLYLATFANLVAERTAVYLRQPFNITSASYHQALEHCQAQKALNTIMFNPPKYKIHYTPSKMCGIQSFKKLRAGQGKFQVNKQIFKLLHLLHSLFRGSLLISCKLFRSRWLVAVFDFPWAEGRLSLLQTPGR